MVENSNSSPANVNCLWNEGAMSFNRMDIDDSDLSLSLIEHKFSQTSLDVLHPFSPHVPEREKREEDF